MTLDQKLKQLWEIRLALEEVYNKRQQVRSFDLLSRYDEVVRKERKTNQALAWTLALVSLAALGFSLYSAKKGQVEAKTLTLPPPPVVVKPDPEIRWLPSKPVTKIVKVYVKPKPLPVRKYKPTKRAKPTPVKAVALPIPVTMPPVSAPTPSNPPPGFKPRGTSKGGKQLYYNKDTSQWYVQ